MKPRQQGRPVQVDDLAGRPVNRVGSATIRPPATATDRARGRPGSMVSTLALTSSRSSIAALRVRQLAVGQRLEGVAVPPAPRGRPVLLVDLHDHPVSAGEQPVARAGRRSGNRRSRWSGPAGSRSARSASRPAIQRRQELHVQFADHVPQVGVSVGYRDQPLPSRSNSADWARSTCTANRELCSAPLSVELVEEHRAEPAEGGRHGWLHWSASPGPCGGAHVPLQHGHCRRRGRRARRAGLGHALRVGAGQVVLRLPEPRHLERGQPGQAVLGERARGGISPCPSCRARWCVPGGAVPPVPSPCCRQ